MEYTVENDGCRLHVYDSGGEKPVLLLIHGVACDGSFFEKAHEYLTDVYRVIRYDRRGHSASTAPAGASYTASAQAGDALAILDRAGCRRADVASCSAGGIPALELARRAPQRVARLFLHEVPFAGGRQAQAAYDAGLARLHEAADSGRITKAMLILVQLMGGMDRRARPVTLQQQARNLENYKIFLYREMDDFLGYSRRQQGLRLSVPAALAAGSEDREGLFSGYMEMAAKELGAACVRLPGWHNLAWDDPQTFAAGLKGAMRAMSVS